MIEFPLIMPPTPTPLRPDSDWAFTVLMAVYRNDHPQLFSQAIRSVLRNTLQPSSFLIVADGPLGEPLEAVLAQYCHLPSLEVLRLPENVGLARALNAALATIQTPCTVRADADDVNLPERFACLIEALRGGLDLVGSEILEVTPDGQPLAVRKVPLTPHEIRRFAAKRNPFNHMSVAFRTQRVKDAGGYPAIHLKEDYALWSTLIARGAKVGNLQQVLVHATTGVDMYRRRGGWKYALAEVDMQRHLVRVELKGRVRALIDGLARCAVFLAPNALRQWVYVTFLRSDVPK